MSKKHPQAGQSIKITEGPLAGIYVKIIDFFQNQFQGKSMEKLAKTQKALLDPVRQRKQPIDEMVIFCQRYPEMTYLCIHNNELHGEVKEPSPVELKDDKVVSITKGKKKKEKPDAT